ncbi:MAG: transporter [Lachnospiraceae bacterium]|jgi:rubrerythrin|nr:transporter [Lachnospiraceae bacterium]
MKRFLKRWFVPISLAAVIVLLFAGAFNLPAHAGFGDFNNYDSGGSDYGSGSSDYDSGSDWGSNNYYSSDSGDSEPLTGADVLIILAVFGVIGLIVFMQMRKMKGQAGTSGPVKAFVREHDQTFDDSIFPDRSAEIEKCIRETDPAFSSQDFTAWVRNAYMQVQDAWCKQDLEPIRPILHENLYNQTEAQIAKKKQEGLVNALESIAISVVRPSFLSRDENFEYVSVYMIATMIDYQYKQATGEVVRGNKVTHWELSYRLRFQRARGAQTISAGKEMTHTCPKCGAPLDAGVTVKCPYCGAIITTSRNNWVLSEFMTVNRSMKDEGISWK